MACISSARAEMLSNAASPPAICDSDSDRVARTLDPRLFQIKQGDLLLLPRSWSANELSVLRRGEHFGAQSFSHSWTTLSKLQLAGVCGQTPSRPAPKGFLG